MRWRPGSAIIWLFDAQHGARDLLVPRWLFLRALGGVYFSAFFSLLFQIRGLIGPDGILPADTYLHAVAHSLGSWERVWYAPTLLDHCNDSMSVVQEETFGPVLAVVRVDGPVEAIRAANQLRYGLGASLWTGDVARGQRLAERLEFGVVSINNHAFTGAVPSLPWTGTRATGFGVANSAFALSTFLRPRTTVVDRWHKPELFWMPYDATLVELGDVLADLQRGRVERAWRLPMLMRRRIRALRAFFR